MHREFNFNPAFVGYEIRLHRLHELIAAGVGDEPAADKIRDEMDEDYRALSSAEIARLDGISADLYSLFETSLENASITTEDRLLASACIQARDHGRWDEVTHLLRKIPQVFPGSKLAYMRFKAYAELGHQSTALLFLKRAITLEPTFFRFQFNLVYHLVKVGLEQEAVDLANKYLDDVHAHPALVIAGAYVKFKLIDLVGFEDAQKGYSQITQALEHALKQIDQLQLEPRSLLVLGFTMLGVFYDKAGKMLMAVKAFSRALELDPKCHVLRVSRGLALARKYPKKAASDFRRAVALGSHLFIPYYFLASYAVGQRKWHEAQRHAELLLQVTDDPSILAEAYQWLAISAYENGKPWEMVETHFTRAEAMDPTNLRISENYMLCRQVSASANRNLEWKKPSLEHYLDTSVVFSPRHTLKLYEVMAAA